MEKAMTNLSNKTITFIGAPEKRIRHRLGLGSITRIKVNELLEIAKNLGELSSYLHISSTVYVLPFLRLQSLQSICRFLGSVAPPSIHGFT